MSHLQEKIEKSCVQNAIITNLICTELVTTKTKKTSTHIHFHIFTHIHIHDFGKESSLYTKLWQIDVQVATKTTLNLPSDTHSRLSKF